MSISDDAKRTREASFGWQIQRIASAVNARMETALRDHGLTLPQFAVMMTVLEHEQMTQAEIGAQFSMPAYAISRAIDHLEATGLLRRAPHPTSRRAHLIEATKAGRDLGPALFAIVRQVNAAMTAELNDNEKAHLKDILLKLRATLRKLDGC